MMMPLLVYLLLFPPWASLVLALLSVATGLACARWMPGVSRRFGLLMAGAISVVLGTLMFFGSMPWIGRRRGWGLTCQGYLSRC